MAAHIPRSQMEEELIRTWSKDMNDLPVYKDLPRLAGRIRVEGQFSKPPLTFTDNLPNVIVPEVTVRSFLQGYAAGLGQDIKTVEPFIVALEKDWYFHVDGGLDLITPEKWKEYGIPDRLIQELKAAAQRERMKRRASDKLEMQELETRTISMFRLSIDKTQEPDSSEDKLEDVTVEGAKEEKKEKNINRGILKEVARVVTDLAARLETEDQQIKIQKKFEELLQKEKFPDLEGVVEDLFKTTIGTSCKTAKVLKVIHQNIIFTAVFQLKSKVPMTTLTRDVRTRDGWRITVLFTKNIVVVSHRRREQSLATAPPEEQYWFEWELRMMFDKDLNEMESAILRITDLQFGENISPRKREEIKTALSSGNLIVT